MDEVPPGLLFEIFEGERPVIPGAGGWWLDVGSVPPQPLPPGAPVHWTIDSLCEFDVMVREAGGEAALKAWKASDYRAHVVMRMTLAAAKAPGKTAP